MALCGESIIIRAMEQTLGGRALILRASFLPLGNANQIHTKKLHTI